MKKTQNGFTPNQIKNLQGSDLEVVAVSYASPEFYIDDEGNDKTATVVEREILNPELFAQASIPEHDGRCTCCGSTRLRYECVVVHKPSMLAFNVGKTCMSDIAELAHFSGISLQHLKDKVVDRIKVSNWKRNNPTHVEILDWAGSKDAPEIARDIARKVAQFGSISEKQVELLYNLRTQKAEFAARKEEEAKTAQPFPVSDERIKIAGVIMTRKLVSNDFGDTVKILVKSDCGNKFWGSLPSKLNDAKVGDSLEFFAKCEISKDDAHFGFFSRPTKPVLTSLPQ